MRDPALSTQTAFYFLVSFFFVSVVLIYLSPKRWHGLLTVFLGLLTTFLDVQSSEVSFTVLLLVSFGFFLGFTKPATPLRTGLLFGLWLPLSAIVHQLIVNNPSTFFSEGVAALIAFIPTFAGSYAGSLVRKQAGTSPKTWDPEV